MAHSLSKSRDDDPTAPGIIAGGRRQWRIVLAWTFIALFFIPPTPQSLIKERQFVN